MENEAQRPEPMKGLPGLTGRWRRSNFSLTVDITPTLILPGSSSRWSILISAQPNSLFVWFGESPPPAGVGGYFILANSVPVLWKYSDLGSLIQDPMYGIANGILAPVYGDSMDWR